LRSSIGLGSSAIVLSRGQVGRLPSGDHAAGVTSGAMRARWSHKEKVSTFSRWVDRREGVPQPKRCQGVRNLFVERLSWMVKLVAGMA
jgi:hypothetical protein